jgi:hypothetical protein
MMVRQSRLEKDVAKEGEQEIALSVAAAGILVFPRSSKVRTWDCKLTEATTNHDTLLLRSK